MPGFPTSGGSGTVTSVGLTMPAIFSVAGSPVTTTGTFAVTLASQSANLFFASPDGSAGAPTFRAIGHADLAPGGGTGGKALLDNMTWAVVGGSGTVTSVALAAPAQLTVTGSPVTGAGTLTLSWASAAANQVFAGPDAAPGTPAFRALVATDIPSLAASKITSGQLANARGGTGLDTSAASNGQLLIGNGTGFVLATLSAGTGISVTNGAGSVTIASTVTGTVTSVALSLPAIFTVSGSPVTTTGTLTATLASQSQNLVWASPNGSAGAPTFRALVADDIPNISASKITSGQLSAARGGTGLDGSLAGAGEILIGNGAGYTLTTLTAGANVTITNGAGTITIASTAPGTGTVTSVALNLPGIFSISGSPVTTSGTLTASLVSQTQNLVWASPNGSSGAPTFRSLVAADIPNLAASKITTGQLSVARGGTGVDASAAANGTVLIGNGTGFTLSTITAGSNVTITNSAGGITIASTASGTGTVTSVGLSLPSEFTLSGSPVTTTGSFLVGWNTAAANTVFSGPNGAPGTPAFRALVAADIPSLPASIITSGQLDEARGGTGLDTSAASNGQLLIGNGSGFTLATITAGANISVTNGVGSITIAATATGGTVTSVALSAPSELTVSGSPVTTSGTLTLSWAGAAANTVFAGPDAAPGVPAFRSLVATDIPSLAASKITSGQLAVARGGTGVDASAAANGSLLIGNGTGFTLATITAGSNITVTNSAGGITIAATGGGSTFLDNAFRIQDNGDATKQLAFEVSGISASTTRTITVPNYNMTLDTLVGGTTTMSGFTTNTVPYVDGSNKLNTSTQIRTDGSNVAIGHSGVNSNYSLMVVGSGALAAVMAYTTNTSRLAYVSQLTAATTTTVRNHLQLYTELSGTPAAGMGTAIKFDIMDTSSSQRDAATIAAVWQVAATATRTSDIVFSTVFSASALTERLRIAGEGTLTSTQETSTTSSTVTTSRFILNSSGTPAANFGQRMIFAGESSTTTNQDMSYIETTWHTATHASRQARMRFYVSVIGSMKQALDLSYGAGITLGYPSEDNTVVIPTAGNTNFWIGTSGLIRLVDSAGTPNININHAGGTLKINGTQVLQARVTGWAAWTGVASRSSVATGSATTQNVAEGLKALLDDLITHGIIGA